MRFVARTRWWFLLPLVAACGCAQQSPMFQSQVQTLQQQQTALAMRNTELQSRASSLDKDNQELQTLLSQSQQQSRLFEDQLTALRDQLSSATTQIAKLKQQTPPPGERKPEAFVASMKPTTPAKITNSSLRGQLPAINVPGVQVRADGDVVRIELPSSKVFSPGTAQLKPEASAMLDTVAADVTRLYPDQIIGIEGHTDNDPTSSGRWASNTQLSVGEAMAIYDYLSVRSRMKPNQMFVVGHGPNHPIVSNGTLAGKDRNRRVEMVIYPDKMTPK